MARIDHDELESLRQKADIVEVISHYIPLQKSGKNFKGVCPFHQDHDPSMQVNTDLQIYKCFVCGNGGNVFSFVRNYEKIPFVEAVGKVADLVGFTLSTKPEVSSRPVDPHIDTLHQILNEAIMYTMFELDSSASMNQREYLDRRGLTEEIRKTFQIGYNPTNHSLTKFLLAKGYREQDLTSANVTRVNEHGKFDVFEGRITFPIHDRYGNPIGFSARTMDPNNPSKYINTNETDVFKKGEIVYNYHRAASQARLDGKVYVCEGVTDVIAFHKVGITNAVCTLGTSCTNNQILMLKKMSPKIVFCYDGDHAGQAATYRAVNMAFQMGCDVSVVLNETGLDPDEMIRQNGEQSLRDFVKNEISRMEFILKYLKSETNMNSYLDKKEMAETALEFISQLQSQIDRQYFLDQLNEMTGFHLQIENTQRQEIDRKPIVSLDAPNGLQQAEDMILTMMLKSPRAVKQFEDELSYLVDDDAQNIAMTIIDMTHRYGKVETSDVLDEVDTQSAKDYLTRIGFSEMINQPYDAGLMKGAIRRVKKEVLAQEAKEYREQLSNMMNEQSRVLIMSKYNKCLQEIRRLMDEEDNERNN